MKSRRNGPTHTKYWQNAAGRSRVCHATSGGGRAIPALCITAPHRRRSSRQMLTPTKPWSAPHTVGQRPANDKDPLERKLRGGCVGTMSPENRLAAKGRVEARHPKQKMQEEPGNKGSAAVVNEGSKMKRGAPKNHTKDRPRQRHGN